MILSDGTSVMITYLPILGDGGVFGSNLLESVTFAWAVLVNIETFVNKLTPINPNVP